MSYIRVSIILVYIDNCLLFELDEQNIEDFIRELEQDGMTLIKEDDAFHFLKVEVLCHNNR